MKKFTPVFLIFFLSTLNLALSQTPKFHFQKISVEEGLSQSIIITIFQDSRGFLWIGTQEGLNKYNGYEFIQYKTDPGDSNSISDNYVRKIIEDNEHNLWIATNGGGLNKYYPEENKFISFMHDESNPGSISDNNITSIESDIYGNLWIGTYYNGLNYFNKETSEFVHFRKDSSSENSLLDNYITELYYDKTGNYLWVGTYSGLNLLDLDSRKFYNLNELLFGKSQNENLWIRDIHKDKKQNIWIATDSEGLIQISNFSDYRNISAAKIYHYRHTPSDSKSISGNSINTLCESSSGDIYIGTWGGGLNKLVENNETGKTSFQKWLKNPSEPGSITENDLTSIYEDKSGVLWIGTYGDGLNKLTPHSQNFTHYTYNPFTKNSLTDNQVTAVLEDEENLWIGTWNGLNRYEKRNKKYIHYQHSGRKANSISGNRITSILKDKKGKLWIGTLNNGLNKFDPKTERFIKYKYESGGPDNIPSNRILSMIEASDGKIWIGSYFSGVIVYDPSSDSFSNIDISKFDKFDKRVSKIIEDNEGNILFGTYKGMYKHYVKNNSTELLRIKNDFKNDILANGVLDIIQDNFGNIWVGTFGNGIYKLAYNPIDSTYEAKQFNNRSGLPNNYTHALQFDRVQNLWISTRNGLAKFNPFSESFETFTSYEGVNFSEFSSGSFFNKDNGKLYFCSMQGLLEFSPSDIEISYSEPQIVITQLKIFNKPVDFTRQKQLPGLNNHDYIELNYDENSISMEFAALNFISPNSTRYSYKLEGFDKEFITAENKVRSATYTNLPSGEYFFKIKAYLGANTKTNYEKEILIKVIPPFWERTWFRLSILVVLIFILYTIYSIRIVSIRKRNEELKKEVKLRTHELESINAAKDKFFSIIAHDLKGPFSYLLSNSEFLAKEVQNISREDTGFLASNINIATTNIYNLLENLLQWSKYQMMGLKMEPREIDLTELATNNIALVAPHASQKRITIEKTIQPDIKINSDENIINTILRNLLMNAIKFTRENGGINVITENKNGEVRISICDTGIGMSENQIEEILSSTSVISSKGTKNEKGTGLGLFLIKEFIEAINGKLEIESTKNKGTKITCVIPNN